MKVVETKNAPGAITKILIGVKFSNNTISNLTFERKNIESEFGIKLEELQDDSSKLQIVLDRIKQGE